MSAPSPVSVLFDALRSSNPNYNPGHAMMRLDAAETLLAQKLDEEERQEVETAIRDIAWGNSGVSGWSARVRASKIMLTAGIS
jgi:hypothetical protein